MMDAGKYFALFMFHINNTVIVEMHNNMFVSY